MTNFLFKRYQFLLKLSIFLTNIYDILNIYLIQVANRLKLKYCTVRTIYKAYEKDGRIGKKETRKKKLKIENILKISILNPFTL